MKSYRKNREGIGKRTNEGGRGGWREKGSEGELDGRVGCERLMRESEKLILTSLWAGRLRKIREIESEGGRER